MRHLFEEYGFAIVFILLIVAIVALLCVVLGVVSNSYV